LYGVGDAAQYYFATPARALTLGQSLYLASLCRTPRTAASVLTGKLKRQLAQLLHRLMQIAHRSAHRRQRVQLRSRKRSRFRVPGAAAGAHAGAGDDADAPPRPSPTTAARSGYERLRRTPRRTVRKASRAFVGHETAFDFETGLQTIGRCRFWKSDTTAAGFGSVPEHQTRNAGVTSRPAHIAHGSA